MRYPGFSDRSRLGKKDQKKNGNAKLREEVARQRRKRRKVRGHVPARESKNSKGGETEGSLSPLKTRSDPEKRTGGGCEEKKKKREQNRKG